MDEKIRFLLTLQEYEQRLARVDPERQRSRLRQLEEAARDLPRRLARARQDWLGEERKIAVAEQGLGEREERLRQCLGQQALSPRPETLQALGAQIARLKAEISEGEDAILQQLEICEMKKKDLARLAEETRGPMAALEKDVAAQKALCMESEQVFRALQEKIGAFRKNIVDAEWLQCYDRVKARGIRPPWLVSASDHRCQGCHIRLSPEQEAFFAQNPRSQAFCEQCGRLLYALPTRDEGALEPESMPGPPSS